MITSNPNGWPAAAPDVGGLLMVTVTPFCPFTSPFAAATPLPSARQRVAGVGVLGSEGLATAAATESALASAAPCAELLARSHSEASTASPPNPRKIGKAKAVTTNTEPRWFARAKIVLARCTKEI